MQIIYDLTYQISAISIPIVAQPGALRALREGMSGDKGSKELCHGDSTSFLSHYRRVSLITVSHRRQGVSKKSESRRIIG